MTTSGREENSLNRVPEPAATAVGEKELLLGWLQFHRDALAAKCHGLADDELVAQSALPSTLSLLGLVRHLTEMERHYFVHALTGAGRGFRYCTDDNPEGDIEGLDVTTVPASMNHWRSEMADADRLLAVEPDLSAPVAAGWGPVRWHLLKMIQEYARHNGHADLIRERIDGSRGE